MPYYCDVVIWHCFGNIIPSCKFVSFFYRNFWFYDVSTIFNFCFGNQNIINHPRNFVNINAESSSNSDIMCRHGLGDITPPVECISFFCRFLLGNYLRSVF